MLYNNNTALSPDKYNEYHGSANTDIDKTKEEHYSLALARHKESM